jgi:glucokinase
VRILTGDIGGTKSELVLYEGEPGDWREARSERLASPDFDGIESLLERFAAGAVDAAGFALAGPVHDGRCRLVNVDWAEIDARAIERALGVPVALANDFAVNAHGIDELDANDLVVLQEGVVEPDGPIGLFGAGTGLGHALAVRTDRGLRVIASEGGHSDFAPHDETEVALWRFLRARHGEHVAVERAVSGPGLCEIHAFVVAEGLASSSAEVTAAMAKGNAAAVITEHANDDEACARALAMFLVLYGAEAGNFALKALPTAGLYIAGGIAPRLIERMRGGAFMDAFLAKGRMRATLQRIRVRVVMQPRLGLLGARALAVALVRR